MAVKLSNITVTHISLVKSGANGKEIIYKSDDATPTHTQTIDIVKVNEEKGLIYGIVYSPNQEDSQGDYTTADEIEKASYGFMKSLNLQNVDKNHDFKKQDAFVCQSWILQKNDALFSKEEEGSWAVAIKLEDEELKKAVKKGTIAGISMAGTATKEKVEKGKDEAVSFVNALTSAFEDVWVDIRGRIKKESESMGKDVNKESADPAEIVKAIKKGMEPVTESIKKLQDNSDAVTKRLDAIESDMKKSHQDESFHDDKDDDKTTGGIL